VTQVDSMPFELIETPEESEKALDPSSEYTQTENGIFQVDSTSRRTDDAHVFQSSVRGRRLSRTPEPAVHKQLTKLTPMPKLRHNDSQINFAIIDSSPSGPEGPDSQFLTTRQREVKERQHQEAAAMFPDLLSSPMPKSRDATTKPSRLNLKPDMTAKRDSVAEEVVSPTLPPANNMTTTFLGSSPTPWSSGKRFSGSGYDDGPPSSPPVVPKAIQVPGTVDEGSRHFTPADSPRKQELKHLVVKHNVDVPESAVEFEQKVEGLMTDLKGTSAQLRDQEMTGVHHNSDLEVFVDAPATPYNDGLDMMIMSDPVVSRSIVDVTADLTGSKPSSSRSMPSSSRNEAVPESPQFTGLIDPDDEVSAQIANDMEIALSQAAEGSQAILSSINSQRGSAQKRKRSLSPDRSDKKRSSQEPFSSVQVVIEKRSPVPDEPDMLDSIVVASPAVEALSSSARNNDTLDSIASFSSQQSTSTSSARLADKPARRDTNAYENASRGGRGSGKRRGRPRKSLALNEDSNVAAPDSVSVGEVNEAGSNGDQETQQTRTPQGAGVEAERASLTASLSSSVPMDDAAPSDVGRHEHEPVTGMALLERLKRMLEEAKAVVLRPGEGREVISAWMELGMELHNAERRTVP
jgi:hypothetical protein